MTVLTAYAPSYAPWLGLFDRISQADVFVLTDTDRLNRKDFHTRNRIVSPTGPFWITIPVKGKHNKPLLEVEIDNTTSWRKKHWRAILYSYKAAPFFLPELEAYYTGKIPPRLLADFNERLIRWVMLQYGLRTPIYKASATGVTGTGSEFILNLCKHFQADRYLCGEGGLDYLDLAAFEDAGVEVDIQVWKREPVSALHDLFTEGPVL